MQKVSILGTTYSVHTGVSYQKDADLTKAVYSKIDLYVRQMFLQLMQAVYKKVTKRTCPYNYAWLESFLLEYDEVSKYVYANEFERKRDRLAEALIASSKKNEEIDAALRYLSFMLTAYAVRVTDQVVLTAYRDMGIDAVRWKAEKDNKTCTICKHRNGHIYDIEQVPPKPHLCYLDAMEGDYITKVFYVGDRTAPLYNTRLGLWQNVSFNLVARKG